MNSTWDKSLETGNEQIDAQHRELIRLLDEMKTADLRPRDKMVDMLNHLMGFTFDHFLMEEELMKQVGYPADATSAMVKAHREFKSYMRLRFLEFREGDTLSVLPLQSFLANQLKIHEFGMDRFLADWVRRQDEAA